MSDVQLKCPACGAPINFDVPSGRMKCNYCSATFSVQEVNQFNGINAANQELESARQAQKTNNQSETELNAAGGGAENIDTSSPQTTSSLPPETPGWVEPDPTYLDEATGEKMAQFECGSCGGEIIGPADMVSTKCPWCNNNFVATGQLTRTRVPDRMIPFGMTKEQALAAFKQQAAGLKLILTHSSRLA